MNMYEVVNQRILELLERGTVPWRKTWNAGSSMPKNICSKKEYRGVNVFMLACMPYNSPYWMTYKQCQDKGGLVRKGEKSTPVIFWKWLDKTEEGASTTGTPSNGKIPMLRFYNVFNQEQTEGIDAPQANEIVNTFTPIESAEQIIVNMPCKPLIQHMGNKAIYNVRTDTVTLPPKHTFESEEEYYATAYHELCHSTMAEQRLNRKASIQVHMFGDESYSKEELVAECGAAFLCGHAGIENATIENSAAYIQGWLRALKNDRTMLVHAAALAQKASDFILNKKGCEVDASEVEVV
jgi:antirestriction protein ArdC